MLEDYNLMTEITKEDVDQLKDKGKLYGGSWRQRGGVGAFMMMARKWDRIHNWCKMNKWDLFNIPKDMLQNDIGDLRRYLLLIETHITSISFPSHPGTTDGKIKYKFSKTLKRDEIDLITTPTETEVNEQATKEELKEVKNKLSWLELQESKFDLDAIAKNANDEEPDAPDYYADEDDILLSKTSRKTQIEHLKECEVLLKILITNFSKCDDYRQWNKISNQLEKIHLIIEKDLSKKYKDKSLGGLQ